ncbi:MAG: hypothetical protein H0V53_10245 [Rubrobacter sp.]|nr:hypothetical protein [Rubrobacter sp.]
MAENGNKGWRGTPLDMGGRLDPYGIQEISLEYDSGDEDVFRPRLSKEFGSYELHQMSAYVESLTASMRKQQRQ